MCNEIHEWLTGLPSEEKGVLHTAAKQTYHLIRPDVDSRIKKLMSPLRFLLNFLGRNQVDDIFVKTKSSLSDGFSISLNPTMYYLDEEIGVKFIVCKNMLTLHLTHYHDNPWTRKSLDTSLLTQELLSFFEKWKRTAKQQGTVAWIFDQRMSSAWGREPANPEDWFRWYFRWYDNIGLPSYRVHNQTIGESIPLITVDTIYDDLD